MSRAGRTVGATLAALGLAAALGAAPAAAAEKGQPREYAYMFFQGKLTSGDGALPLAGVTVRLRSETETFEAVTDPSGNFVFDHLPVAAFEVSLASPDGRVVRDLRELDLGDPVRTRIKVAFGEGPAVPFHIAPSGGGVLVDVPAPRTRWNRLGRQLLVFLGGAAALLAL